MSLQPQETFQSSQLETNTQDLYATSLSFSAIMDQPTPVETKPATEAGKPPAGKGTETAKAKDAGEGGDKEQAQAKADDDVPEAVKKYLEGQGKKPAQGPSGPVERDTQPDKPKDKPDAPAKPGEVKDKYDETQIEQAKKAAKEKGVPLVVVVGSDGCGWCKKLDKELSGPDGVESQYSGKAVFLHINASQGAPGSEEFTRGVRGYPTTKIGTIQEDGSFKAAEVRSGYMDKNVLQRFIGKHADK